MNGAQAKADLIQRGISIRDWAAARGFAARDVYAVLSGRVKGHRGKGHAIAVALGIKPRQDEKRAE
ncbi:DNA-binding protein [Sinimarinibacterium flocculans]|uniref:DNA-binding protein n=1 Tax=Sinimarinibacterium flocculans TaxID=985250 RepID=UPI003511DB63